MDAPVQYEHRGAVTASVEDIVLPGVSFYDIAEHFHDRPGFALLDTQAAAGGAASPASVLSFEPFAQVRASQGRTQVRVGAVERVTDDDPLEAIARLLERYRPRAGRASAAFGCGAIGYFAYELGRRFEALPTTAANDLDVPECDIAFYNFAVVLDRETGALRLCHLSTSDEGLGWRRDEIWQALRQVPPAAAERPRRQRAAEQATVQFVPSLDRPQYLDAVDRIKEYIRAGDVYQVNLTLRFRAETPGLSPWAIYKRLLATNPAPYAAYLNRGAHVVVCSSPELFLEADGRSVVTRPIKGTMARAADAEQDARQQTALLGSDKNRAELAMIVDLMRNDLGRVCRPGSVRVEAFPELETYPSLHHLVATIVGTLEPDASIVDVIRATFPGGSITGAPKIRAMEIIDECEPIARGVYTGSIGYLGFDGSAKLNIAIRTLVAAQGAIYIHAGGGIVADSVPADEYDEVLLKAGRLFDAVSALA